MNDRFSGHRFSGHDHFSRQIIQKTTFLEENEPVLFTGLEDTTALEDKKGLTVFSAKPVVHCSNLEKWPLLHKLWLNIDLIYLELMDFSWGTHRTFKILANVGKKGIP